MGEGDAVQVEYGLIPQTQDEVEDVYAKGATRQAYGLDSNATNAVTLQASE